MSYPHLIVVCFLLALCFQCQGFKNLYINRQINFKTISPLVSRKITLQATNAVLTTTATPSIVSKLTTVLLCVSKFALNPAISGGVLSGALHAVTGTYLEYSYKLTFS